MSLVFKIVQNLHSGMLNNQAMLDYSLIASIVHNPPVNFKHFLLNHKMMDSVFSGDVVKRFHDFPGIKFWIIFKTIIHIQIRIL